MVKINLDFVEQLTLKEKADLVSGKDFWFTATAPGIKRMMVSDGPSGLRKKLRQGMPKTLIMLLMQFASHVRP